MYEEQGFGADAWWSESEYRQVMSTDPPVPLTQRLSPRAWVTLDVALAGALLAGTVAQIAWGRETRAPSGGTWDTFRYFAAVFACLPLVFRRRWPTAALAATAVGDAILVACGVHGPATTSVGFAMYTVAVTSPRRVPLPTVGAAVAVMLVGALVGALVASGGPEWAASIAGPAPLLVGWFAGENVRARRAYQEAQIERSAEREREREERVRQAATDERVRIARELHDIVAHAMSLIAVRAGAGRMVIDTQPDEARKALSIIETTSRKALREMRRLVGVLRQTDEPGEGEVELEPAPQLASLDELIRGTTQAGVHVDLDVTGDVRALPAGIDVSGYRIIQEALTNVVRHVGPTNVHLYVRYRPDEVEIELIDEGTATPRGRPANGEDAGTGHGLVGMRERVALYRGELVTGPVGNGYRVLARLPTDDDRR
jgi:signal transduction histidine kinase